MRCIALLLILGLAGQDDDFPIAADAPDAYKKAMENGNDALSRKRYADAAREFGAALRAKPNDKVAQRAFGRAIKELEIYNTRYGDMKAAALKRFGMDDCAGAIAKGLKFLAEKQEPDGRWKCKPTDATDDVASTSFALLALLADGHSTTTGDHAGTVAKGIAWLVKQQNADGSFTGSARLYTEGIATLVLVEAFVMGGTDYGVMLAFLAGGDAWTTWRDVMKPHLLETQEKDGRWEPKGAGPDAGYADYLSVTDATSMALLSLECCYRYVPKAMLK